VEKLREGNQGERSYLSIKGIRFYQTDIFWKAYEIKLVLYVLYKSKCFLNFSPALSKRTTNIKIANTY
jgi:hypothetical protein